jgi:hypothetical protein
MGMAFGCFTSKGYDAWNSTCAPGQATKTGTDGKLVTAVYLVTGFPLAGLEEAVVSAGMPVLSGGKLDSGLGKGKAYHG